MNTNEQIVSDLAEAWRTLNPELLIQHLAPEFNMTPCGCLNHWTMMPMSIISGENSAR